VACCAAATKPFGFMPFYPGPGVGGLHDPGTSSARRLKVPLYARTGIHEVWLLDLSRDRVEIYRQPTPEGYRENRSLSRDQSVAPLEFPDLSLVVDDLLG